MRTNNEYSMQNVCIVTDMRFIYKPIKENSLWFFFQEVDIKEALNLVTKFIKIVKDVVNAIERGVQAFKDIINADYSLNDMVNDFKAAFEELPDKVLCLVLDILYSNYAYLEVRDLLIVNWISM